MPTYLYGCDSCKNEFQETHKVSERKTPCDLPCEKCGGKISIKIGTPTIVSGVSVRDKRPDGWKDVLKNIHKSSGTKSTIDV